MQKTEYLINVNTPVSGNKYWIKIHRNNQYIPYHLAHPSKQQHPLKAPIDDWLVVQNKKKPVVARSPIYYWVVSSHNLCDRFDQTHKLYFIDPDATQIENLDQSNCMAIDKDKQLRLIHTHLKHRNMKMTPMYYIAHNVKQIEDALNYVKYCVVKVDNNEQKLVDLI